MALSSEDDLGEREIDFFQNRDLDLILTERATRFYDPKLSGIEKEKCILVAVDTKLETRRAHVESAPIFSLKESLRYVRGMFYLSSYPRIHLIYCLFALISPYCLHTYLCTSLICKWAERAGGYRRAAGHGLLCTEVREMMWYAMLWNDMIWYDMIWCNMICY